MTKEKVKDVVRWGALSVPVRIGLVGGWMVLIVYTLVFLIGFAASILGW